jgi:hypothetical protein
VKKQEFTEAAVTNQNYHIQAMRCERKQDREQLLSEALVHSCMLSAENTNSKWMYYIRQTERLANI